MRVGFSAASTIASTPREPARGANDAIVEVVAEDRHENAPELGLARLLERLLGDREALSERLVLPEPVGGVEDEAREHPEPANRARTRVEHEHAHPGCE